VAADVARRREVELVGLDREVLRQQVVGGLLTVERRIVGLARAAGERHPEHGGEQEHEREAGHRRRHA